MNENETNQPALTPAKPKRTRKPKARAARIIDPEVKAIRDLAKEQVKKLKLSRNSYSVFSNIKAKLLPKLTDEHRNALFEHLRLEKGCCESLSAASAPEQAGPITGIN